MTGVSFDVVSYVCSVMFMIVVIGARSDWGAITYNQLIRLETLIDDESRTINLGKWLNINLIPQVNLLALDSSAFVFVRFVNE